MIKQKFTLSTKKPVLSQLLSAWNLNYLTFAEELGIKYKTLLQYRRGERQLRLNTIQIKRINELLVSIGLTWSDLPDDWILETTYGLQTDKTTRAVAEPKAEYKIS